MRQEDLVKACAVQERCLVVFDEHLPGAHECVHTTYRALANRYVFVTGGAAQNAKRMLC